MNQSRRSLLLFAAWSIALPVWARAHKPKPKADSPTAAAGGDEPEGTDSLASPANTLIGPLDTVARWAIVVDYNTNATLLDKAADEEMTPSSLTKLMTAYLTFEALKSGKLTLNTELNVSQHAWETGGARTDGSTMFLPLGASVRVEDLIRGMIIQSGNDACIVLAEGIAGTEGAFVAQMNDTARRLGLTHSHFVNCTGLPDPNHYMSARDIATLATHLIRDFPEYYHYDAEKSFTYNNIKQENRNPLVQDGTADGLKTGHTEAGGYGLCASAEHNGRRVIIVLNGMGSKRQRRTEGQRIMDWAFANFEDVELVQKGQTIDHAGVWLGVEPSVPLAAARSLTLTLPTGWRDHVQVDATFNQPLTAPIAAGTSVGTLDLTFPGFNMLPQHIALVTAEDIPEQGLLDRALTVLRQRLGHRV